MPSFSFLFSSAMALAIATGIPFASGMLDNFAAIVAALH